MQLTILGCHSATPRENKHTTSQLLEVKEHLFLIDCGEGTQIQLRKTKVKFSRIQHIFISHLHGDHFYGLIGLISTFRLLGRTSPLTIYGPVGIKEIITLQLKHAKSWTNYPLHFHELTLKTSEVIFEDESIRIQTLPLDHRVYTNGFLFSTVSTKRKINVNKLTTFNLKPFQFQQLQNGESINLDDGRVLENEVYTIDPERSKKYAYCSDTAYCEEIIPQISNTTLLYHEATFLQQHAALALKTMHSTARQAALIAKKATVGTLLLGHYSGRYNDYSEFKNQAQEVFLATQLAQDGKVFEI